jgi:propionyl-CoA synthetase
MIPRQPLQCLLVLNWRNPFSSFGGFAPHELAIRIDDCKPRLIITASSGIEVDKLITYKPLVDEAMLGCRPKKKVIVFNRKLGAQSSFKKYDGL